MRLSLGIDRKLERQKGLDSLILGFRVYRVESKARQRGGAFTVRVKIIGAARVQNETAPEKFLNRYEKRFEKREKGSEKRSETRLKNV